jgi:hypothetical protein
MRCNGYNDCVNGEDEDGCVDVKCPGLYRCRESTVCLPPANVCDGWEQCPKGDDELICDVGPCPEGCLCQGLAFVCHQPFSSNGFPSFRYLVVLDVSFNISELPATARGYLIHLRVNNGSVTRMPTVQFPNLKTLDLGDNAMKLSTW